MDSDPPPPQRSSSSSSSSDLFICFSSRLSSSMKHNAAVFNKTSPMFSATANKNPEPSSPKVTCIGQVRVKAKKQRQRRHSSGGEVDHQSICVAFRSIRADFSCLIPCKSSCFSSEQSSYGAAAEEEDKPRQIQFLDIVEDDDVKALPERRHVFDNLEIEDLIPKTNKEEGRISICVPPKNALLLMRCRSDPLKMADLTSRVHNVDKEEESESEYADVDEFEVIDEKRDPDESKLEREDKVVMEILINKEEDVEEEHQLIDSELKGSKSETDHHRTNFAEGNEVEEAILEKQEMSTLPDCLILMMCEPKLSMEVSKETWVCSRDFIRRPLEKKIKKINGHDEAKKKIASSDNPEEEIQAHPAMGDMSMATETLEEKLVNAVGCEPFVLTRCNSVPISNDSFSWKNRNLLEPHRHSCVGLRTAEVGF